MKYNESFVLLVGALDEATYRALDGKYSNIVAFEAGKLNQKKDKKYDVWCYQMTPFFTHYKMKEFKLTDKTYLEAEL